MTSTSQAKRIVIVGCVGAGVLASVAVIRTGGPIVTLPDPQGGTAPVGPSGAIGPSGPRPTGTAMTLVRVFGGTLIVTVLLTGIAEFQPGLAAGFAALMLATAAFYLGGDAWEGISAITAPGR